jgi:hypothetical protein
MKSAIFSLLTGLATLMSSPASAHDGHFPGFALARATYDCPPGPGYMTFAVIDTYQNRTSHQLWVGSREICLEQATKLQASRAEFYELTLLGICTGQDEVYYLRRWSVDPYGRHVFQGQVYYGTYADCMQAADATNR